MFFETADGAMDPHHPLNIILVTIYALAALYLLDGVRKLFTVLHNFYTDKE